MTQTTVRYFVTDVDEAIDFYCNRLGFQVDLPGAPGFAGLAKDDLRLLLHEPGAGGAGKAGGVPKPGGWNRFQIVYGIWRDGRGASPRNANPPRSPALRRPESVQLRGIQVEARWHDSC